MSKFLRQMTALSKKPSDFQRPLGKPTITEYGGTHVETPTVVALPTVVDTPTVLDPATDRHTSNPNSRPNPRARLFRALLVQDGHSLGEQAVYEALWRVATPEKGRDTRTVSIGYDRLARIARLNEKSIRQNIRSLREKLAVDIVASENSAAKQGKTYRLYAYEAILTRRRAAGMEWVIKNKGVRFVAAPSFATVVERPTVVRSLIMHPAGAPIETPTVTAVETPTVTMGVSTGASQLELNAFRNQIDKTSSSDATAVIATSAAQLGVRFDDDAARKLVRRCRDAEPEATIEEIAYFLELKIRQLKNSKTIENWVGLLITSVPLYFSSPATELARYRNAKAVAEREGREARRQLIAEARKIIDDPGASDQDKALAESWMNWGPAGSS